MIRAKGTVQLSIGALVLSVTFLHEVVGAPPNHRLRVPWLLMVSWSSFLIAILTGAFYQYHAIKYIELNSDVGYNLSWSKRFDREPYWLYAAMLITFVLGAALFTVGAIAVLR
jgi:hypothetical protein